MYKMNMQILNELCCICLKTKKDLHRLMEMKDDITYFMKLTTAIPEMCFQELNEQGKICSVCCANLDIIYRFKAKCMKIKPQLRASASQQMTDGDTRVRLNTSLVHDTQNHQNITKPGNITREDYVNNGTAVKTQVDGGRDRIGSRKDWLCLEDVKTENILHQDSSMVTDTPNDSNPTSPAKHTIQNNAGNSVETFSNILEDRKLCEKLMVMDNVVDMKFSITNLQDQVNEIKNLLLSFSTTQEEQEKRKESQIFFSSIFPLRNEEQLIKIEKRVHSDHDFQSRLVQELSRLGGLSVDEHVGRILYKLFTNELACKYTWLGGKQKKKPFYNLGLVELINKAVFNNRKLKNVTHRDIQDSIKNWLRRAKERLQHQKNGP